MDVGPLASLLGAIIGSLSVFKYILVGLLVVGVLYMILGHKTSRNALEVRALKDLVKSSAQWATRSVQDTSPLVALMNANYAMAYLNVARSVGSDADIEKHTGAAVDELLNDVEATQTNAIQRLALACPAITPQGLSAVHTGWLSK